VVFNCLENSRPRLVYQLDGLRFELGDRAWWAFVKPKVALRCGFCYETTYAHRSAPVDPTVTFFCSDTCWIDYLDNEGIQR
jgi:hypothetical protein